MWKNRPRLRKTSTRDEQGVRQRVLKLIDRARRPRYTFLVLMAIVIGLAGGTGAIVFRYLIRGFRGLFASVAGRTGYPISDLPWWWILLMPALGGLLVGPVVCYLAPEVRGSGIPEVIEAVARRGGKIRKRVALVKATVAALCIGSGGSAGREGPIVHIGAAIGSLVGQVLAVPVRMVRTFVACGSAAGIAATFNAPIAGAMFASEVILEDFGVARFSAVVISSVVATVLSRHFIGDLPAFVVPSFQLVSTYELLFYALLGLGAAMVGCLFIWLLERSRDLFERLRVPEPLKPAVGGLAVGLVGIVLPLGLGVGYEGMNQAMLGPMSVGLMLGLLAGKMLMTTMTLGSGGSGGVFAPSLFMGAMFGGAAGVVFNHLLPGQVGSPGAYALVTMGAVVSATTRAPIAAIIIIFEMTDNYTIILPLMIACILAVLLAPQLMAPSIYHTKLLRRGIDLEQDKETNILRNLKVKEVWSKKFVTLEERMPLPEVLEQAVEFGYPHYITIDADGHFSGMIHLSELRYSFFEEEPLADLVIAQDLAHSQIPTVEPDDDLDLVMRLFGEAGLDTMPVVDPKQPRHVIAVVVKDDVIGAYNRELMERELADGTAGWVVAAERTRAIDLGQGCALLEIPTPPRFVGKTLIELDLRRQFHVQVIMIRRTGDPPDDQHEASPRLTRIVPGPDHKLIAGDLMLLMGAPSALDRLAEL